MIYSIDSLFLFTCIFTSFGFILIGWLKSYVAQSNRIKGILETLVLGAIAAIVAYYVGDILEGILIK